MLKSNEQYDGVIRKGLIVGNKGSKIYCERIGNVRKNTFSTLTNPQPTL